MFAVTAPLTGCVVVPTGSMRTGAAAVPISVPELLRRLTWKAREDVMRGAAALPLVTAASASLNTAPTFVTAVVPAVNAELSEKPADAVQPTTQLTLSAVLPLS